VPYAGNASCTPRSPGVFAEVGRWSAGPLLRGYLPQLEVRCALVATKGLSPRPDKPTMFACADSPRRGKMAGPDGSEPGAVASYSGELVEVPTRHAEKQLPSRLKVALL